MPRKSAPKPKKDTPAKQYERFLETAREVGASNKPADFEKAFKKVTLPSKARLAKDGA